MGKPSTAASARYQKKAYDRVVIFVSKGGKDELKEYAETQGESLNAFVKRAIQEAIENDKKKSSG